MRKMYKVKKSVSRFMQYSYLLRQLVVRDLKIKYRRSFLGYIWSVLNPLLVMCVMTVVFSTMFKRNIENFPVYLITGQILFNFMNNSTNQAMRSIIINAPLLKKTDVPKYIFPLSRVTSALVDFLFSLGALILVMLFTRVVPTWRILLFPFIVIQLYAFCIGLGFFLAQANLFFRDIEYIYKVVITAWTYLTPIFYPIDMLSDNVAWAIRLLNPMYSYVTQFRDIVLYGILPRAEVIAYGCFWSALFLAFGLWSFRRSQNQFILYI